MRRKRGTPLAVARRMQNERQDEKPIGTLVKELSDTFTALIKSEVALAKVELKESTGRMATGAAMFGAAAVLGVIALALLITAAVLALAIVLQPWAAAVVLGLVVLIAAVALVLIGKKKLTGVSVVPTAAVEGMKADVQALKQGVTALKEIR